MHSSKTKVGKYVKHEMMDMTNARACKGRNKNFRIGSNTCIKLELAFVTVVTILLRKKILSITDNISLNVSFITNTFSIMK